ncbi:type II secretion system protein [Verrucomicrobium spinosum]
MQASPDTDHRASSARRAFTLVELLVSISVLASS